MTTDNVTSLIRKTRYSGGKPAAGELSELRDEADIQAPRRREGVAGAKEGIELFVRRKVRRGRNLPQVQILLWVRLQPRLVVEDVQHPRFERKPGASLKRQPIRGHQVEIRPSRIAMTAG